MVTKKQGNVIDFVSARYARADAERDQAARDRAARDPDALIRAITAQLDKASARSDSELVQATVESPGKHDTDAGMVQVRIPGAPGNSLPAHTLADIMNVLFYTGVELLAQVDESPLLARRADLRDAVRRIALDAVALQDRIADEVDRSRR